MSSPLRAFGCTSDPVLAFDNNGNVYYVGISCNFRLFLVKYINDGAAYSSAAVFSTSTFGSADKPWIAVDRSGGPTDGNVYISYDCGGVKGVTTSACFIRSTDGGQTWSTPISAPGILTGITVDPSGRVVVSGVVFSGRSGQVNIVASSSTNGGLDLNGRETVASGIAPPNSLLPGNQFRDDNPIPQLASDNAGIYIVWDDFSLGNSNVMFAKSTDGGKTWTPAMMVNDVVSGQHFFSTVAAGNGAISIAWYDSRNGQETNGTITSLDVYYAQSNDGGATFSTNLRVTSVGFNPNIVERADSSDMTPFMGDYIQVAASPGTAHVIWADNRNACDNIVQPFGCTDQDAFTASIST